MSFDGFAFEMADESGSAHGEKQRVAVVGGCGEIGSSLSAAIAGFCETLVIDKDADRVELWRARFDERPDLRIREVSTKIELVADATVIVVVVGTEGDNGATRGSINGVVEELAPFLNSSHLLLIRSTVSPGTTRGIGEYLAERGVACDLVVAPERSLEGVVEREVLEIPQLLGGPLPAVERATSWFESMGMDCISLPNWEAAELSKLITNGYRYFNFQLANYFEVLATQYECSFDEIRTALRASYPRAHGLSRAGFVGGPCLPKDAKALAVLDGPFGAADFMWAPIKLSERYEEWVVGRIEREIGELHRKAVGIVGMGFKRGSSDKRGSRAVWLAEELRLRGAEVLELEADGQLTALSNLDCLIDVHGEVHDSAVLTEQARRSATPLYTVGVGWHRKDGR